MMAGEEAHSGSRRLASRRHIRPRRDPLRGTAARPQTRAPAPLPRTWRSAVGTQDERVDDGMASTRDGGRDGRRDGSRDSLRGRPPTDVVTDSVTDAVLSLVTDSPDGAPCVTRSLTRGWSGTLP